MLYPNSAHDLHLPRRMPTVIGLGAWYKNTLCLIDQDQAFLTQTIGDLEDVAACEAHQAQAEQLLEKLPPASLKALAHDLHPDFFSSRLALQLAALHEVPVIPVQHHHAHIAAVCAENHEFGPVLGLALDGIGLGTDGRAWGGELMHVQGAHCARLGHLNNLALPGGDKAAREPWRMAASVLSSAGRGAEIPERFAEQRAAAMLPQLLQARAHCPQTSSMGRVFDAAAGLLGICSVMRFEAEAAILLEQSATAWINQYGWPDAQSGGWSLGDESTGSVLNLQPLLLLLADWPVEKTVGEAAALFHATLVAGLCEWVVQQAAKLEITTVALAGGCFLNRYLSTHLPEALQSEGLNVLQLQQLSPGDASIALGQAWVAALLVESGDEGKNPCV